MESMCRFYLLRAHVTSDLTHIERPSGTVDRWIHRHTDEGIMQMQLREVAKLEITADFAYGDEPPTDKIPKGAPI